MMENMMDREETRELRSRATEMIESDDARTAFLIGGSVLTLYGITRFTLVGGMMALVGGGLAWLGLRNRSFGDTRRGIQNTGRHLAETGRNVARRGREVLTENQAVEVDHAVTVNRPPSEVYRVWHDFGNLERFMQHIDSVEVLDGGRSRWTASIFRGAPVVTWEAETIEDVANKRISWRSVPNSPLICNGTVQFRAVRGGTACEVHLRLDYKPKAGMIGATVAAVINPAVSREIREDLRRFKRMVESGELATTAGQPQGGYGTEADVRENGGGAFPRYED